MSSLPRPPSAAAPERHGLASILMRRSVVVVALGLLAASALGVLRMNQDIAEEVEGAQALSRTLQALSALESLDDTQARAQWAEVQQAQRLRHVELCLFDEAGRSIAPMPTCGLPVAAEPSRSGLGSASGVASEATQAHVWPLRRPEGHAWQVQMRVSEQAERAEARSDLMAGLALMVAGALALLGVMRWNLKRVFAPLDALLGAIAGIEREDHQPLKKLATMPVDELERIAAALRHLAAALEEAQARRRVLSQQMLTLQEDERARLARELHDELGQRLTSMRVDAAWLVRKLPADDPTQQVLRHLEAQCEDLQVDVRQMLGRLRPLGPNEGADPGDGAGEGGAMEQSSGRESTARLAELLQHLVQGWSGRPSHPLQLDLQLSLPQPEARLPRALVLAVYRLSQEALTNMARHAQADSASLSVALDAECRTLVWQVQDNGVGLGEATQAMLRGSGLAGMQERVHALGGRFEWGAAAEGPRPGLMLRASFELPPPPPTH